MLIRSLIIVLCLASLGRSARGDTTDRRRKLADTYLEDSRNHRSIFQGAPINHIIPAFNTITYALELEQRNVLVEPENTEYAGGYKETLKLGGYKVSPYLALSLKHVGIGFSLEGGRRTVEYKQRVSSSFTESQPTTAVAPNSADATANIDDEQKSVLDYRAVGVYIYLIPFPKLKEKKLTLTLILGGRNYSCRHEVGSSQSSTISGTAKGDRSQSFANSKTYPYTVTAYESGLNLIYKLSSQVGLVPWGQFYYADTKTIELLTELDTNFSNSKDLNDDIQIMWHDRPQFEYGLDLAVKVARFEIRLGGAIGAAAAFGASGDRNVKDTSFSLALSYDMKGG